MLVVGWIGIEGHRADLLTKETKNQNSKTHFPHYGFLEAYLGVVTQFDSSLGGAACHIA